MRNATMRWFWLGVSIVIFGNLLVWWLVSPKEQPKSAHLRVHDNLTAVGYAYHQYVIRHGIPPTKPEQLTMEYFDAPSLPVSPITREPIRLVPPGSNYKAGDVVLVPAKMTYSYYDELPEGRVKTTDQGYWLIAIGDGALPFAGAPYEGWPTESDLKKLGLDNVVVYESSEIQGYSPGVQDEVESLESAWLRYHTGKK